ncbi:inorganic diphosphatase [Wolbachia endosymbiont of Pentalonia nigronervosa]|jgi:inorganic pyrophosphatase|uniref:inorganic diphosphatase n=1 Tax=Wolbachia endosymbiont of Pentalonia nigronervosa TaxID=1301914 RepID=UPI00165FB2FA|nr:inorganic diphosphatase [Wolbachia endosymbiont of Pentalonia nigronervosa]MBD0391840.1 inorganic diphosphatase [Wolbachia endosymbiont of Pentalonia nigronervosa]
MDLSKITSVPSKVNVIIEISAGSEPIKYEFNKELGLLQVDRFLFTSMTYPCNYGFIPNTKADDDDPVDVLVLTQFPLASGVLISVRPVGALLTADEKGQDEKILAVPVSSVDSYYDNIKNYSDLPQILLDKIVHFFSHYKDLEKGKTVTVGKWVSAEEAQEIIEKSHLVKKY